MSFSVQMHDVGYEHGWRQLSGSYEKLGDAVKAMTFFERRYMHRELRIVDAGTGRAVMRRSPEHQR